MSHVIVITDDEIVMEHPTGCVGCAEGAFIEREGFGRYEMWPLGRHPVEWFSDRDVEGMPYDGLQLTQEAWDYYVTSPDDRQPVRGFPYSGGRWSA